ncbi:hypothetical protein HYN48_07220 [Flavobacterium magnum]|uniref:YhhN-like protein n=1 Tax=Flavobacterium magnum TaxID=2162713 RepID=A0A2S0RDR1_9FLAO|nr:hypothetical protein [Flavobacterium magnum]AWA29883.1 hypothetical protein HYN48_07220 [Flavobacterium magnum]
MGEILALMGYVVLLINLALFAYKVPQFKNPAYRIFTLYLAVIFLIQISSYILSFLKIHNLYLSHFYFIAQFIALSIFYNILLKEPLQKKIVKMGLVTGLTALTIQYAMNPGLFFRFNLFEIFITSFLLIIYSTFHFYNLLNKAKAFYYLNSGILVYLFGSTVLFLAGNLVSNLTSKMNTITWTLNAFLYIVYQAFIFVEWKKSFSGGPNTKDIS